jgi:uncharacterized SAM-binding protein YcdF (DUF218 family)
MFRAVTPMRKWIFKAALVVSAFVLLLLAVAFFFPRLVLCVDSGPVTADVIVVLGGGLGERPERAAELFKQHAAPCIIVSGQGDCDINRRLLIQAGVPAHDIETENQSRTTRENALLTIKLLREQHLRRVILVTSWYHSRRALACFRHYAPDIQFYSRPSYFGCTGAARKKVARQMRLEYLKLPGYWVCYGVCPF